jgi:hypothetical protein
MDRREWVQLAGIHNHDLYQGHRNQMRRRIISKAAGMTALRFRGRSKSGLLKKISSNRSKVLFSTQDVLAVTALPSP